MKEIKHLSVHQWLRSATPDSQQPTSPIGFLFLKLPPPPCAVLLVYTIYYVYIYTFVHLANRSGGSCLFSKGGVNEEKRLWAQMNKISGFYVNLARSRFLYRNPKLDRSPVVPVIFFPVTPVRKLKMPSQVKIIPKWMLQGWGSGKQMLEPGKQD